MLGFATLFFTFLGFVTEVCQNKKNVIKVCQLEVSKICGGFYNIWVGCVLGFVNKSGVKIMKVSVSFVSLWGLSDLQ